MMNEPWSRLQRVVNWTGLSVNSFAKQIGLLHAENIYRIKRGYNGISKELAHMIAQRYPVISRAWLLTGEGSMIYVSQQFPYYKTDASIVVMSEEVFSSPDGYISLPFNDSYSFAAYCASAAMEPAVRQGTVIILKKRSPESVVSGGIYLVNTANLSVIRRVKIMLEGQKYLLVADKKSKFDPIEVEATLVKSFYEVCGTINMTIS